MNSKTVLITGGTKGIGFASADILAKSGYELLIISRDSHHLSQTILELSEKYSSKVFGFAADVQNEKDVRAIKQFVRDQKITLVGAVLAAGVMSLSPIGMWDEEHIQSQVNVNTSGTLRSLNLVANLISPRLGGSIVLFSSVVAHNSGPGQVVYAGTKASIEGIAKASAQELGRRKIRVNAIAPGVIATGLISSLDENALVAIKSRTPLGRIGSSHDVAAVVEFLISEKSSFVTGAVIPVDGGYRP
jgi:3-oxoacyl-[acyl-carrier protein] reductase